MGLSYAPFGDFDDDPGVPRPPVFDPLRLTKIQPGQADATECNYLVMFFVIGVFAIALVDGMKSPN